MNDSVKGQAEETSVPLEQPGITKRTRDPVKELTMLRCGLAGYHTDDSRKHLYCVTEAFPRDQTRETFTLYENKQHCWLYMYIHK